MVWGAAIGALAGGLANKSGSSTQSSQQLSNQITNQNQSQWLNENSQLMQQLSELLQQQKNLQQQQTGNVTTGENLSGTVTTDNLSKQQRAMLDSSIQNILGQLRADSPYSAERANEASALASKSAIDQVLRSGIGNVAAQGANFGAYGSTVQGNMASQLGADAAAAGSKISLDTLTNFASLDNQRTQGLNAALAQLFGTATNAGGTVTTDQSKTGTQDSTQNLTGQETTTQDRTQDTTATESKESSSTTIGTSETENEYETFKNKNKSKNFLGF